jgi:competence protein ComEC
MSIAAIVLAFQTRKKIMLLSALTGMLVIVTIHTLFAIQKHDQRKLVFFSLRKNTAFAFFSSTRSFVFTDLDSADKTISYSVNPAVQSQSNVFRIIPLHQPFENQWIYSDGNLFIFNKWKLLVWNKKINQLNFSRQIHVDAVLLSGKPKLTLKTLTKFVRFKLLIIDGSNPEYMIDRWTAEARHALVKVYVLKNNPAYSISLN